MREFVEKQGGRDESKGALWKDDQKCNMSWGVKFLAYSHVYKFDKVSEKGANFPKREKDVLDPSVLDLSNAINNLQERKRDVGFKCLGIQIMQSIS